MFGSEAVEGGSLRTNLIERAMAGRGGYSAASVRTMARSLLRTLAAVHAQGIAHRNVRCGLAVLFAAGLSLF
eukprot:SAG11_NODE_21759_length_419_cov_0.918750_1_plen_72_part_00